MWPASGCWLAVWKKPWPAAALHVSPACAVYIMTRWGPLRVQFTENLAHLANYWSLKVPNPNPNHNPNFYPIFNPNANPRFHRRETVLL